MCSHCAISYISVSEGFFLNLCLKGNCHCGVTVVLSHLYTSYHLYDKAASSF